VIAPTYSKISPRKEMQDKMIPKDSLRMLDWFEYRHDTWCGGREAEIVIVRAVHGVFWR